MDVPRFYHARSLHNVYDEHGGIFDHVLPPPCTGVDGFTAQSNDTGTGRPFNFDRLGVRVPAVLVSPWVQTGAVENRTFEHASIPATVTELFLRIYDARTDREQKAQTFLDLLSRDKVRDDAPVFQEE